MVIEPGKMNISEPRAGEFGGKSHVHQIAGRYVSKLPHVPYKAVGLNCRVSMQRQNAAAWLKSRFLKTGKWLSSAPRVLDAMLKLQLEAPNAICNLTLQSGKVELPEIEPERAVVIDCNFHYEGPFNVKQIKTIVGSWPNEEVFLLRALSKLLVGQLK